MPWGPLAVKDQVLEMGKRQRERAEPESMSPGCCKPGQGMHGLNICRKINIRLRKILKLTNKKK
jgi:hypothetical protein